MSDHPENEPDDVPPIQGQVRYTQVSARVPEEVGDGCFASAVMVMTGPFETVLDFILRLTEKPRVVARVVLPPPVVAQFVQALKKNIAIYEANFGPLPRPPQMKQTPPEQTTGEETFEEASYEESDESESREADIAAATYDVPPWSTHQPDPELQEPGTAPPETTSIEQIYEELRLPDELLSGRYANAVLIRHSPTEYCFDFITNIFPRSAVSTRVYLATANVGGLLQSLQRSLGSR